MFPVSLFNMTFSKDAGFGHALVIGPFKLRVASLVEQRHVWDSVVGSVSIFFRQSRQRVDS